MSYYHVEDSCVCGSEFKYDDQRGVYSKADDLKYLGQDEYRLWLDAHKSCRDNIVEILKAKSEDTPDKP